jgi:hypothetical protein
MLEKKLYTEFKPTTGAAMMLTHHSVEPTTKAAYVLFFTAY